MQVDFTDVMWLFKRVCLLFFRTCWLGCFCKSIFNKRSRDILRSLLTGSLNRSGLLFNVFYFQLGGKHCRTVSIFWLCLQNTREPTSTRERSQHVRRILKHREIWDSNSSQTCLLQPCSWLRFGGWKIAASHTESKHQKGKKKKNLFIVSYDFLMACCCKCFFYLNDLNLNVNVFI